MQPGNGHLPALGMHGVTAPSTALSREELHATQSAVLQPSQLYGGHIALGLGRESPDPSTFTAWWRGVFFSGFASI